MVVDGDGPSTSSMIYEQQKGRHLQGDGLLQDAEYAAPR
jgi:hypothetical protein